MKRKNIFSYSVAIALTALIGLSNAHAAKGPKAPKGPPPGVAISAADIFEVTVKIKPNKGKPRDVTVSCLDQAAGATSVRDGVLYFLSYAEEKQYLTRKLRRGSNLSPRKKKQLSARLNVVKAMANIGQDGCLEPDFLSLRPYKGTWGETQVRRLLEVAALGAHPTRVPEFVGMGIDATVADLLTLRPDPYSAQLMDKLSCDPNPDDAANDCYENGDQNDFYLDGIISALNYQQVVSTNPVHMALREWVMDQRAPGNPRGLNGCNLWMFKEHLVKVIDPFFASGDYKQYVLSYVKDSFGHGKWLSGAGNHVISAFGQKLGLGNEDFARELLELLLMGPNDKDGNPNYTDLDILKTSFVLSGYAETEIEDPNGNDFCAIGYFPHLHFSGAHSIFTGTPYEISIQDSGDSNGTQLALELFRVKKKQISYELARRLWGRFISGRGTPAAFTRLANLIEENDFKLFPVMEKIMKSRAFYAPESAETIMKNPHTLLTTYLRMTGFPIEDYNWMRDRFDDIGMLLARPPTVFGFSYNNELLASDVFQLERFNSMFYITMWQNLEDIKEEYGWTPHSGLIAPIARTGVPEDDIVNAMISRLNLTHSVTPAQRAEYVKFIANYLGGCPSQSDPQCFAFESGRVKLFRDVPDMGDTEDDFYRTRLLLVMLGTLMAFQTM